jgi:hypothetical protein
MYQREIDVLGGIMINMAIITLHTNGNVRTAADCTALHCSVIK